MRAVRILRVIKVLRLVGTVRMAEDVLVMGGPICRENIFWVHQIKKGWFVCDF